MAEMIKKDLEAVGLKVKLVLYDWPSFLSRTKSGEHQLALFGWIGDHSDPDNFFSVLMSCAAIEAGSNRSRWCSKEFDDLIAEANKTSDNKKRSDLYRRAQIISRDSVPMVPIAHAKLFKFVSKKVSGYQIDPLGTENFVGVKVSGSQNKK
jgi:dipeptide transport system substrate-binding protein